MVMKDVVTTEHDMLCLSKLKNKIAATRTQSPKKKSEYNGVVITKPWGWEYLIFENKTISVWMTHIRAGLGTSLHCHANTDSSLLVLRGTAKCKTLEQEYLVEPRNGLRIQKSAFHSLLAVSDIYVIETLSPPDRSDLFRLRDFRGNKFSGDITHNYHSNTDFSDNIRPDELVYFPAVSEQIIKYKNMLFATGSLDYLSGLLKPDALAVSLNSKCGTVEFLGNIDAFPSDTFLGVEIA